MLDIVRLDYLGKPNLYSFVFYLGLIHLITLIKLNKFEYV